MKIDMRSPNPCMWDPVAYRIKYINHPHVGDKWCIYPSYDFQHCLVDSLENIDYSLCTLEFEVRRESYYWLVDQLNVWRAYVWEFGRLNITNTVMSKRKLKYMVMNHIVHGWDDPRMPTIKGLRRRVHAQRASTPSAPPPPPRAPPRPPSTGRGSSTSRVWRWTPWRRAPSRCWTR